MAIDHKNLDENLAQFSEQYVANKPFPSLVLDRFLTNDSIQTIQEDFPEVNDQFWTHYIHYNERKHGLTKWEHFPTSIQKLIVELQNQKFIIWLEQLTGIKNLFADVQLEGSGLHQTKNGGYLNIHADFTVHPKHPKWQRRVNVLVYLNDNWNAQWGGHLELWNADMTKCEKRISPVSNRCVIFSTSKNTYHGYPNPISCPENQSRKSIALYYYTEEDEIIKTATSYKARPTDGAKKWLIWADSQLISTYSYIKGVTGLNDDFVSSILNIFNKKK
ncbi:MAG: Rps23 Pro-64 3,4-dihydroxylase Tpa1-like proline 4-hydroxylase [Salibacteraceae bacterium]|jgi:Rps23 Pro-64 3,4-dihydroxylase Tpa1-like proline 4-hydroxylase